MKTLSFLHAMGQDTAKESDVVGTSPKPEKIVATLTLTPTISKTPDTPHTEQDTFQLQNEQQSNEWQDGRVLRTKNTLANRKPELNLKP